MPLEFHEMFHPEPVGLQDIVSVWNVLNCFKCFRLTYDEKLYIVRFIMSIASTNDC